MRILPLGLAGGLSAAGLWFAFHNTNWTLLKLSFQKLDLPVWLAFYPLVHLAEFYIRTWRFKILLAPLRRVRIGLLFPITAAAFFANTVLPFRAGEIARTYWTSEKTGVPFMSCLSVLAVDRLFDMLGILTLAFVALSAHPASQNYSTAVRAMAFLVFVLMIGFAVMARFPYWIKRFSEKKWVPPSFTRWSHQFMEGSQGFRDIRLLLLAYVLTISFWGGSCFLFAWLSSFFGLSMRVLDGAVFETGLALGVALPSTPGFVGTYEAGGVGALSFLGYPRETALAFVMSLHFMQVISTILWGLPSLWLGGLSWRKPQHVPFLEKPAGHVS